MFLWFLLVAVSLQIRLEQRANIKFCKNSGLTPIDTWRSLHAVYGNDTLSKAQVRFWFCRFTSGDNDLKDKRHSGRPNIHHKKIQQVSAALDEDRRKTTKQLAAEVDLSEPSVRRVLRGRRFVPKSDTGLTDRELVPRRRFHAASHSASFC